MSIKNFLALARALGVYICFRQLSNNRGYLFSYMPSGKRFRTRILSLSSVLKFYNNYDF